MRRLLLAVAVVLAVASVSAQTGRPAPPQADALVRQVRTALGHANLAEARRLVESATTSPKGSVDLAMALVNIYEGKDDDARTRLAPLAQANPLGDAAVELGLIEVRRGQRDEGRRRLDAIASNRNLTAPEDYFRLARAARGRREFQLSSDGFHQIENAGRAEYNAEYGDMFLQRHAPGDAADYYKKALASDPAWVSAYLGLTRAFGDDDPKAAQAEFEAAKKLVPESPDLWLLVAGRAAAEEDYTASAEALDHVAKVRAGSMDEAVIRVTLAYQKHDPAVLDAAIARVHEIDPRSAAGYQAASEAAAQSYRFDDAAALARQGLAIDPDDGDVLSDLGMYLLRTGDEQEARAVLERSWRLDTSIRVTKNMLDLLDKLDTFEVVTDGPITFKFDKQEAGALRPYALPLGREAYDTFKKRYDFTPQGPILLEIFPKHDDFAVRTLGLPGIEGALGACFGRVVSMDSPEARPPGEFSWHATEWHELAHVFTLQLSNYRVPRWLTEGISVFEEYRRQPAWGRELTLEFAAELSAGHTFGFKGMTEAFKHPHNLSLAYFEASLVVEHLVELKGDEGLRTLLKAYGEGANDADAFTKAFGKSLDEVDTSYKAFIEARYGKLRDAMKEPAREVEPDDIAGLKARASAAPGNFISQVSLGQALFKVGDMAGAKDALEHAAALVPMASGDASPHGLLAEIAIRQSDEARARRELRALLTYDHANVNAARRLATLAGAAKATDDEDFARKLVADLDPFDSANHSAWGQRLLVKGDNAAALVEFQSAMATKPANMAEARADLAEAYLKLGRREEARRQALEALKLAPTFARAQDLLLAALGKR
ncbi:MAG: tetratricopeptide repeat protein [Vicinamibacterales bacterium]